jgi:hypothetical protein
MSCWIKSGEDEEKLSLRMFTGWNHMDPRPEMWRSATNKVLELSIRRPSNWKKTSMKRLRSPQINILPTTEKWTNWSRITENWSSPSSGYSENISSTHPWFTHGDESWIASVPKSLNYAIWSEGSAQKREEKEILLIWNPFSGFRPLNQRIRIKKYYVIYMVLWHDTNLFLGQFSLARLMKSICGTERAAVSKIGAIGDEYPDLIPDRWDIAFLDHIEMVFRGPFYVCVSR